MVLLLAGIVPPNPFPHHPPIQSRPCQLDLRQILDYTFVNVDIKNGIQILLDTKHRYIRIEVTLEIHTKNEIGTNFCSSSIKSH